MTKYSYIIPTIGREEYLLCAISSIERIHNVDKEIIIIDDNPNSDLKKLGRTFGNGVTYVKHEKNMGPGYSRKEGFLLSTGDYIIFMDDDDFYIETDFLKFSEAQFLTYPNLSFVAFNANNYYMDNHRILREGMLNRYGFVSGKEYLKKFQVSINKPKSTFTTVFKKSKLIDAHIDEMEMVNDTAIFLRALLVGDAYLSDLSIGNYRIHDSNITKTLSAKFIVENLEEKKRIFDVLVFNEFERYKWFYVQSKASIVYFYANNRRYKKDDAISKWLRNQNFLIHMLLSRDIYISIFKRKLKKMIRG